MVAGVRGNIYMSGNLLMNGNLFVGEAHHAKLQINSAIADIFVPKKWEREVAKIA